jgi:hypothetical protein
MSVLNRRNKKTIDEGGSTLATTISLRDFAQAMAQFDLSAVPPEKRRYAIRAHMLAVMSRHLVDKQLGGEIADAYLQAILQKAALQ